MLGGKAMIEVLTIEETSVSEFTRNLSHWLNDGYALLGGILHIETNRGIMHYATLIRDKPKAEISLETKGTLSEFDPHVMTNDPPF